MHGQGSYTYASGVKWVGKYRNTIKQIGHRSEIHYHLRIIDDKLLYNDDTDKKLGYQVVERQNINRTETHKFVTSRSKKKVI